MQRIVICDPSDNSREHLRSLLLGIDFAFLDAECKRYDAFLDILAEGGAAPDLAIIHLDNDPERAVQLVAQISTQWADMPLLVISSKHGAILEALQAGAKQFITEPYTLEHLLMALRKALTAGGTAPINAGSSLVPRVTASSQVIAILGARGGVGCTSLAVNLGCCLAADPENSVTLVDLDLALGDAGVHLALTPNYTLADLAANIDKLDLNFLKRSLVRHEASALSVLDRPVQISDLDVIQGAHVERILNLLRLCNTHLVIDLSKRFTTIDAAALAVADEILLVSQLELSAVLNATRIIAALGVIEGIGDKIKVVLNKQGLDETEDERHRISPKKAEEIIGKPFYWQVPYDPRPMNAARNEGQPLARFAPRCRVNHALQGLANALSNKGPANGAATPAAPSNSFFRSLFSK